MHSRLSRCVLGAILAAAVIPLASAQERERERGPQWDRAHQVVSRTMDTLRHIERRESLAGDERDHYDRALRALSDVDRSTSQGRFDRGRLDEAIEQVDRVSRSRMLDPQERDRLLDDLRDLRRLRDDWRG